MVSHKLHNAVNGRLCDSVPFKERQHCEHTLAQATTCRLCPTSCCPFDWISTPIITSIPILYSTPNETCVGFLISPGKVLRYQAIGAIVTFLLYPLYLSIANAVKNAAKFHHLLAFDHDSHFTCLTISWSCILMQWPRMAGRHQSLPSSDTRLVYVGRLSTVAVSLDGFLST